MFDRLKELYKRREQRKKWARPKDSGLNSSVAPRSCTSEKTSNKIDKHPCTYNDKVFIEESTICPYNANNSEIQAKQSTTECSSESQLCNNNKVNQLQQELQLYQSEHCTALNQLDCLPNPQRERVIDILNDRYPPIDFLDFCVIASENDLELAQTFVEALCNQGLCGRVAGSGLGADILQEHDVLMNSSTKIMFLITQDFTADRFCRRLQSAAVFQTLLARISQEREKCVPVFFEAADRPPIRVPLPLIGLAGLNLSEPRVVAQRIRGTYTAKVKRAKILRALNYLEERESFCKRILSEISFNDMIDDERLSSVTFGDVDTPMTSAEGIIGRSEQLISGAGGRKMVAKCSEQVTPVKSIVSGVESLISGLGIGANEGLELTMCDEQVLQHVNVEGSSDVHVGPQINLIVNVHNGTAGSVSIDSE